ncbi:MAG TPA: sulfatase [Polyangia bacterium]
MAGILERRHRLRRALAGGVMLGVAAGLGLGIVEVVYVLMTAGASFDGAMENGRFVALTVATLAGAGALVGAAEGLIAAGVTMLGAALGDPRRDQKWQARLYTALAVPPVALVCARIFRGPHAQTIAHHDAYAVAIGAVALASFYVAVRLWQRIYHHGPQGGELAPGVAWLAAAVCAAAAILLYTVDQRVLVRLYPFFHAGLGALAFGAAELAMCTAALALRRRLVRLVEPRNAALVGLVAVAAGATALAAVNANRALRTVVLERAVLTAPLVRALRHGPPPSHVGPSLAAASAPLPEGPHLGTVDIFLITVDAMRADRLAPRTAPTLAALAQTGVVFDRAYTQVPHTSFSLATLLTGKFVFSLSALGLDTASHQTLPEVLKRERYKTAAFYPPSVFTIDRDRLRPMEDSRYGFEYVKYEHMNAPGRTDQIIHFLDEEHPEHVFVWAHYFEPHEPYERHPGHLDGARDAIGLYDGEVHFVDGEIARLIAYLKKTRPHALVILAADHGEEFGEHGGRYHGTTLYEEQVHVPLVFVTLDKSALPPHHVAVPVGLVDVAPTILALIGIPASAKMRGHDLGPWLGAHPPDAAAHGPVYGEIDRQKMIIDGDHKLVCDLSTDSCHAFDLAVDAAERKNRIDAPFAAPLRARLDAWMDEESRFESAGTDARVQRILDRARLGDAAVARELPALLPDPALNREIARLLAVLPPDPANRRQPMRGLDPTSADWIHIAGARLGEEEPRAEVRRALPRLCAPTADAELCARAALAVGDVPALAGTIDPLNGRASLDEPLTRTILATLGKSHDARAFDALLISLGQVRTRLDSVAALAALDDARALPTLLRWTPNEPYVPVRAAMVALVAQLARKSSTADARAMLAALAKVEREPPVMATLLPALHALGDPAVVELARATPHTIAGGELWLVGSGSGTLDVGATRATMVDGVARLDTARAQAAPVRANDGDANARFAFTRPKP